MAVNPPCNLVPVEFLTIGDDSIGRNRWSWDAIINLKGRCFYTDLIPKILVDKGLKGFGTAFHDE